MESIGFRGGGTRASDSVEAAECVVELNHHHQVAIQYPCHNLPQDLHQANYLEVSIPL